ncbi:hypothetical protein Vretimale_10924 [Volvox reticuliferus]|uniref:Attractin/MKLN-like beta-propeller domain-containing protein n=1 Tax=Volvox reticuliferus TaxID=1737510 RepID=A0A8J4GG93_9CHLO|nr:hypothetical protein Vretifemale_12612 [Volvox reticuliferus]GIM06661.1 hypothetical protein Vretimale_10924 [Volvox reticuliferus]
MAFAALASDSFGRMATFHASPRSATLLLLFGALILLSYGGGGHHKGPLLVSATNNVAWTVMSNMPYAVGESSSGILTAWNGWPLLVVVGYNNKDKNYASKATMVLDINNNSWTVKSQRPFPGGHHMAAVTVRNKMYLIGGLDGNTSRALQIYDPVADAWSIGAPPSFTAGAGTAVNIQDTVFYCGGINNGDQKRGIPLTTCAKYDVTSNVWMPMAPMPHAVHHASMGTDGKSVYVFGGRNSTGNNGYNPVNITQIYDPKKDVWTASTQSNIPAALPVSRGGMGPAIFIKNRFFLQGGEVKCGGTWLGGCPNPTYNLTKGGVFNRIDNYDPGSNKWARAPQGMSVPVHGSYPVLGPAPNSPPGADPVVYVCGGGDKADWSAITFCAYMRVL